MRSFGSRPCSSQEDIDPGNRRRSIPKKCSTCTSKMKRTSPKTSRARARPQPRHGFPAHLAMRRPRCRGTGRPAAGFEVRARCRNEASPWRLRSRTCRSCCRRRACGGSGRTCGGCTGRTHPAATEACRAPAPVPPKIPTTSPKEEVLCHERRRFGKISTWKQVPGVARRSQARTRVRPRSRISGSTTKIRSSSAISSRIAARLFRAASLG